jgi:hypothetical protein
MRALAANRRALLKTLGGAPTVLRPTPDGTSSTSAEPTRSSATV